MNARAIVRRSSRAVLSLGIVGAFVGFAASPASAASSFSVTSNNSDASGRTYTSFVTFNLTGSVDASFTSGQTLRLRVHRPGTDASDQFVLKEKNVSIGSGGTISASLDTSCVPWAAACTPADNGDYTFTFTSNGNVRGNPITVTLAVRPAKPDAPTGFTAAASGTVAAFGWNTVSDVDGYRLYDGDTALADVDPSLCDGATCAVSYNYGPAVYGTTHTFHAVALRDGASGTVESDASATKSVTFPDAPADPSTGGDGSGSGGSGSGGGTGGGGTGGSGDGGTGSGSGGGGKRSTSGDVVHDLNSSLPTVTAGAAPNLPSVLTTVKPLPQGDFEPVLPYDDQYVGETERTELPGKASAVVHDVAQVLETGALWRGLGGAAVLMLVVAHLRAWVERVEVD
jgi:uncharacterized membrane protein YgcG